MRGMYYPSVYPRPSRLRRLLRAAARRLLVVGAVLLALALLLTLVAAIFITRPFPDYRGTVRVEGLSSQVEILRDEFGVPHIYAASDEDLAFGQGYAHAQDRFWQMEFWRRIGAGRLAEVLGPGLVETDRYLRTMGFARVAREEFERLPSEERRWLEAYAAGVNAYIGSRPPRRLGLEFAILGLTGVTWELEAWTPVHTLTWAKIMAQDLSGNLDTELRNLRALLAGSRPLARALDVAYPPEHPVIVDPQELEAFRAELGIEVPAPGDGPLARFRTGQRGIGSNSWVIGPSLSATGGALLANDMHLSVQMPSIWYEVGLHRSDGSHSLRGYSFPGVPGVVAGQNQDIAWGITNLGGDVQDLFVEQIDPEDPDRYLHDGRWQDMERRVEEIRVEGQSLPVEHVVRSTRRGPVISDLAAFSRWASVRVGAGETGGSEPGGIERASTTALSLGWTALEPGTIVQALYALNRARNHGEFRDAVELWDVPGQNLVYADREGTIAYQSTGVHPIRSAHQGQLPARGGNGEDWNGRVPFDHLPGALNPPKGYIVTANNPVTDTSYEYMLGRNFANGYRARRIVELIEESPAPIDAARIGEIHADVTSLHAEDVLPYLTALTPESVWLAWDRARPRAEHPWRDDPDGARELIAASLAVLTDWNAALDTESAGALIFSAFWNELVREALSDEVPAAMWPPLSLAESELVMRALLEDADHPIWDDRLTEPVEGRADILRRAMGTALVAVSARLGDDPRSWRWGDAHTVTFRNGSLGQSGIAPVEALFNRGPYPVPGGPSTVNVSHWLLEDAFGTTVIASQRAIYDLADPSRSRFMHPTGQSGHPFHPHYADYIDAWLETRYHPSNWRREDVLESAGRRRLILQP